MSGLLAGRRAVVTGAGDIGRAVVAELASHGATVAVWEQDERALGALVEGPGPALRGSVVDVTSETAVAAAASETREALGGVDILVNTAAILGPVAPVRELAGADWRRLIDVNLTGVYLCCRALLPALSESVHGSIVNVSSVGGVRGEPMIAGYCAGKFGVVGFSESLADELGEEGVRVNCVCPGAVDSAMNEQLLSAVGAANGESTSEVIGGLLAVTALGRLVTPGDVAGAVVFLCSDLAAGVTRQSLLVDCGLR